MELDIEQPEQLLDYLGAQGHIHPGEEPVIRTLAGGVSNRTVLVERQNGENWVIKQALAKLRVAVDWFSSPERIHREAMGIRWLGKLAPPGTIPPLVFEDHIHHLLCMVAVPQPHQNWKSLLLAGQLEEDHIRQFGRLLGVVHRRAWDQQERVASHFEDRSFFETLRLEPYYAYSADQCPAASNFLHTLIEDTLSRRITLVHGDYSPKNILVYESRLVLLDHEVIHWGEPAFDLGFALTHLLSKAHYLVQQRDSFLKAAFLFWQVYGQSLGAPGWAADLESRAVRHTIACLLARSVGRSPLEYLAGDHRARQRDMALTLIESPPGDLSDLVDRFKNSLGSTS